MSGPSVIFQTQSLGELSPPPTEKHLTYARLHIGGGGGELGRES